MSHSLRPVSTAVALLIASALSACGGGSESDPAPAPAPAPGPVTLSLSGQVVRSGPVKNAVVCLDLNANAACDADEPASAKTGADGAYAIVVDTAKVSAAQVSAASLISPQVPGTVDDGKATIDMSDPTQPSTTTAYVLRQVPGKAGAINPLTTLVAAGVKAGMTETAARANVVIQLGLTSEGKIDNFQSDPLTSTAEGWIDSARMAAQVTASALQDGATLSVGDQLAAVAAGQGPLRSLSYTSAGNYRYLDFLSLEKPAGTAGRTLKDSRAGQASGAAVADAALYNQAYLTPQGWTRCDASVPIRAAIGTPTRSVFCNARASFAYNTEASVTDQSMADFVTQQQTQPGNVFNVGASTTNLLAALGAAKFPAGSTLQPLFSVNATRPIFINSLNSDGRPQAEATTLEQLVAAKPASAVNLSTAVGTLSLGVTSSVARNLRVAFTGTTSPTQGTVQYYECDLNAAQTVASNCATLATGTYGIETMHGVRVMRFAGHPETTMTNIRLYVEVKAAQQSNGVTTGDWVYQARQNKPGVNADNVTVANRLSTTGWQAMKTQLGLL